MAEPSALTVSRIERVILVDEADREVGASEKLQAHQDGGALHRAFSICLLNDSNELLLQRRARSKYHFGGLWTNSCCGHPRPGEDTIAAGSRRLVEELGVVASLKPIFTFLYTAEDPASGLSERELDHVLLGRLNGPTAPEPNEVEAVRWCSSAQIAAELRADPSRFTPWFIPLFERLRTLLL